MDIKQLVREAKDRLDSMSGREIRALFIKYGYEDNETKKPHSISHVKDGQEDSCSSEVKQSKAPE